MNEPRIPLQMTIDKAELEAGDRDVEIVINHTSGTIRLYIGGRAWLSGQTTGRITVDQEGLPQKRGKA